MRLQELVNNLGAGVLARYQDVEIKGIGYNSKDIEKDFLFVAIDGKNSDGHDFINDAISRGAKVVVYQENYKLSEDQKKSNVIFIPSSDTREALSNIACRFYQDPSHKLKCIGVTGTNGKTTITYLLESMLKYAGKNTGVIGTVNYRFKAREIPATNTTLPPGYREASF